MMRKSNKMDDVMFGLWKRAYDVALAFKKMASWEWMQDSDVFGVVHPETGEIGYCCIMGMLGDFFGMAVYVGDAALATYRHIQYGDVDLADPHLLHSQNCLLVSFAPKKDLSNAEKSVINALGLRSLRAPGYPSFQRYETGFVPDMLSPDDALFVTICLEQALVISEKCKNDPQLLSSSEGAAVYVVRQKEGDCSAEWDAFWHVPKEVTKVIRMTKEIDADILSQLESEGVEFSGMVWELDCMFAPVQVAPPGERAYFPMLLVIADQESGFIVHQQMMEPDQYKAQVGDELVAGIRSFAYMPKKIVVRSSEMRFLLRPCAHALDIDLEVVDSLPAIQEVYYAMKGYFNQ